MERRGTSGRLMAQAAAVARIEEMAARREVRDGEGSDERREGGREMTSQVTGKRAGKDADREFKAFVRAMWALGDYHRFAKETVWELGPVLVEACGISAGQRVLDVAAGTGNAAIRAAEAGANVVASDLTPENFEAGRREARARGVELEWREADAEALPFRDGEFDVVMSSFGAMFAPDHQAVADELLRVSRPGGTIGMVNFTPDGLGGEFFGTLAPYMPPPPPGALPPVLWGSEEHVRELFADGVESLEMTRKEYVERAASPIEYRELFKETFGPVVSLYASLADQPDRAAALDRDFLEYATRSNRGAPEGPAEYHYEYLLVVATKRNR
jgi:ubiquinone/menaquinone biosynthesis C-methylase UbiE